MAQRGTNQHHLLDAEKIKSKRFVIIGAGAIGSFYAMALAKMGAENITVYDRDTIEEHNIDNQMYPLYTVGKRKVEALSGVVSSYGGVSITQKNERWTTENAVEADIVVSAVDNMDVRKTIWDHYKNTSTKLFIDGRMSALVYRVYGIDISNKNSKDYYEGTLYPQSEASIERCGEKSIIFTVLGVAHEMLNNTKQFLMNEYRPTEIIHDIYNNETQKHYTMSRPEPQLIVVEE